MGAALFVLAPLEGGMESDGISRVIQGIITEIEFIGAGAILKLHEKREIEGLTTAAGVLDDRRGWNRCWFRTIGSRRGKYDSDVDHAFRFTKNRSSDEPETVRSLKFSC